MVKSGAKGLKRYHHLSDMPEMIPIFPLSGAVLLPRGSLPLNIFEPRYLSMIDEALSGDRIIGMVQPDMSSVDDDAPTVYDTGCAGRITSYNETEDGRYLISLTGICRFRIRQEVPGDRAFRQADVDFEPYLSDLVPVADDENLDRDHLLAALKIYLEAQSLRADWDSIAHAPSETLINSLCMICPFDPSEKQALLEALTVEDRAETLIALIEMASVDTPGGPGTVMQ